MKITRDPFRSDVVEFTWLDLFKLALGKSISDCALVAKRSKWDYKIFLKF